MQQELATTLKIETVRLLAIWVIFHAFFVVCYFFFKLNFFAKNSLRNNIRLSNSLDADQVQQFVRVQTVCKSYQKVTLVGKELNATAENIFDVIF